MPTDRPAAASAVGQDLSPERIAQAEAWLDRIRTLSGTWGPEAFETIRAALARAAPEATAAPTSPRAPDRPTEGWVCRCYRYHALDERWCANCNDEWHAVLERVRLAHAGNVEQDPRVAGIAQRIYRQMIGASKDPEYSAIFARRDISLLIAAVVAATPRVRDVAMASTPPSHGEGRP